MVGDFRPLGALRSSGTAGTSVFAASVASISMVLAALATSSLRSATDAAPFSVRYALYRGWSVAILTQSSFLSLLRPATFFGSVPWASSQACVSAMVVLGSWGSLRSLEAVMF